MMSACFVGCGSNMNTALVIASLSSGPSRDKKCRNGVNANNCSNAIQGQSVWGTKRTKTDKVTQERSIIENVYEFYVLEEKPYMRRSLLIHTNDETVGSYLESEVLNVSNNYLIYKEISGSCDNLIKQSDQTLYYRRQEEYLQISDRPLSISSQSITDAIGEAIATIILAPITELVSLLGNRREANLKYNEYQLTKQKQKIEDRAIQKWSCFVK